MTLASRPPVGGLYQPGCGIQNEMPNFVLFQKPFNTIRPKDLSLKGTIALSSSHLQAKYDSSEEFMGKLRLR